MEIRQARKSSVSIMPVFFCGGSGTETQGGSEVEGKRAGQGQEGRAQMVRGEHEMYGFGVRKGRGTQEEEM